jgi:hypothetical protein
LITLKEPPYKNSMNQWLTVQLFYERWSQLSEVDRAYTPVFSLGGLPGYIDCRKTFLEVADPTGYLWAMKYLGSWQHFEKLLKCTWFTPEFESWVSELKMLQRSLALENIRRIASEPGPQHYLANKFIATGEVDKALHGRGRPSNEEVRGELKRHVDSLTSLKEDAERIGLKTN